MAETMTFEPVAEFMFNCDVCTKLVSYNDIRVRLADGRRAHRHCAEAVTRKAQAPQQSERKFAKCASTCPSCGEFIPAGAPLFYDSSIRRYISDCCL